MILSFIKRFRLEREVYNRVYNELASCSDRELQELGFFRADIASIARQAAEEESAKRFVKAEAAETPAGHLARA